MKHSLSDYDFPADLKEMSEREMELLSYEIRDFLLDKVSKTGGHIASNLGVVELSIALHKVFDSPKDKIIWDVGHQSYVHKILTGRAAGFDSLRCLDGMSGFPKREESPHDMYDSGHSSTSISAAMGYAAARDLMGEEYNVISVIGDGALTGGVAYEAMNNAGDAGSKLIVILNDNEMSISENIGGMSQHLSKLRASKGYLDFKKQLKKTLKGIPRVGEGLYSGIEHLRDSVKYAIVPGAIFEELGFKYFGPVDGHNLHDLIEALNLAKVPEGPVLVHIVTKKGKGYRNAENDPGKFHGVGPFDLTTGKALTGGNGLSYSQVFGKKLVQLASRDQRICAISAAMVSATGLSQFQARYPDRLFDVGIAEQHAVSFAAGLALSGCRPVVAIYSTFLQRAYDEVILDVCMQKLPVVFAIDRAGCVGNDGETHHGVFDLSYLTHMPNMTVLAPKDGPELAAMLEYAVSLDGPCAIRYPRGEARDLTAEQLIEKERSGPDRPFDGSAELLREGSDVSLFAVGKMNEIALEACNRLKLRGIDAELINVRSVTPPDEAALLKSAEKTGKVITLEDNVVTGGFGAGVLGLLAEREKGRIPVAVMGWPDRFIEHGSVGQLFARYGLDAQGILERTVAFLEREA